MFLRGYVQNRERSGTDYKNKKRSIMRGFDKKYVYNPRYEPIRGSDIFCELPPKNEKFKPDYYNLRNYEIYYNKKYNEEKLQIPKPNNLTKSYSSKYLSNGQKNSNDNVYNINVLRYSYNPYDTTYNSAFKPVEINSETLVGNDKYLGTGVAYNSRKNKIEFLKSNIFCDRDKYNQNSNLRDNFDPKNINHNNWYTNLDWRSNKSELIFYKNNQKEFYDNNSKENEVFFLRKIKK